jgi:hypothetical protein
MLSDGFEKGGVPVKMIISLIFEIIRVDAGVPAVCFLDSNTWWEIYNADWTIGIQYISPPICELCLAIALIINAPSLP